MNCCITKRSAFFAVSIVAATLLLAASLDCHAAKQQHQPQQINGQAVAGADQQAASHSKSWLPHAKSRSSRSLSDMFEKVKSKIFGSKKSSSSASSVSASSQIAPSASSQSSVLSSASSNNLALQRQPWDVSAFNQQQFGQFGGQVSPGNQQFGQWPAASAVQGQNPFGLAGANQAAFANQLSYSPSGQPSFSSGLVPSSVGMDTLQASASSQQSQQAGPSSGPSGILSSASHLISQYLTPGGANQQSAQQQQSVQQQQQAQSLLTPNQQSQYNEFASMLDSMVAQTGLNSPMQQQQQPSRQPNAYPQSATNNANNNNMYQQQQQPSGNMMSGDNEMMGSSNVQILAQPGSAAAAVGSSSPAVVAPSAIAPSAGSSGLQAQASSKSNMEGRFKLHIPFLNQHVKRSDHQQQQQQQQLLNQQQQQSYYNQPQQQQYTMPLLNNNVQGQQAPMMSQASQQVATIVNPAQSSAALASNPIAGHSQASPSSSIVGSPSQSVSVSSSSSSSSSSAISQQSPSVSSSQQ